MPSAKEVTGLNGFGYALLRPNTSGTIEIFASIALTAEAACTSTISNSPVYVSYNHGQIFNAMDIGLPNTLVFQLAGTPDDKILFAATSSSKYPK